MTSNRRKLGQTGCTGVRQICRLAQKDLFYPGCQAEGLSSSTPSGLALSLSTDFMVEVLILELEVAPIPIIIVRINTRTITFSLYYINYY